MAKKNEPTIATHDSHGNLTGSLPTRGKIVPTASAISSHPAILNKATGTVPFVQRWTALDYARSALEQAQDDLLLERENFGGEGVPPGQCAMCLHPHHTSRPLALMLGEYTTTSVCGKTCRNPRYNTWGPCICGKSVLASNGQARMYRAEQKVVVAQETMAKAEVEVAEPRVNDHYFVIRGFRSRNKHGYVVLTKSDRLTGTKVLLEFRGSDGQPTYLRWFPLKKLERSQTHIGLFKEENL